MENGDATRAIVTVRAVGIIGERDPKGLAQRKTCCVVDNKDSQQIL